MDNFQLYRTNIALGGQMKWDLILESGISDLFIKDFHLSPVSDYIPFNYKSTEDLLNYSHEENIKTYYKENSGFFYQNLINPELENNWLQNPTFIYNNTVDMGCKRPKNYSVYKKQFEFLVPMWIEYLNEPITFIISISKPDNDKVIASKSLILNIKKNYKYHNKFVNYFNNYINNIKLNEGNNDVINISLKDSYATINGIDLKTGKIRTAQDQNIIHNLLLRERPLMENDNMITQVFQNNKMIAKQLFNFNLCFNIEDILSSTVRDQLYGKNLNIKVQTKIGNELLLIKDFYTNYEYISKVESYKSTSQRINEQKPNVLSYMSDDKAIDLIDKNKIKSNIIHWSLVGNNDYIFNLYDGFSSYMKKDNQIINVSHLYNDTPDTNKYDYDESLNNLNWINYEKELNVGRLNQIIEKYIDFKNESATCIKAGWIKNLYFDTTADDEVYAYLGIYNNSDYTAINNAYGSIIKTYKNSNIKYIIPNSSINFIIFLIEDSKKSEMTFKSFSESLESYDGKEGLIIKIKNILTKLKSIPIIVFNNSLDIIKANSPDIANSTEIEYIKNNNCPIIYIARYDGKIKPTFIDNKDEDQKQNFFYKRIKNDKYEKYNNSGYVPLYPSLNYFSIGKDSNAKYDTPIYDETYKEFKWFNKSNSLLLIPELILKFTIKSEDKSIETLNEEIKTEIIEQFKSLYNIDDKNLAKYIYNFYKYDINFDYTIEPGEENNNIPKYIYNYTINTILK